MDIFLNPSAGVVLRDLAILTLLGCSLFWPVAKANLEAESEQYFQRAVDAGRVSLHANGWSL